MGFIHFYDATLKKKRLNDINRITPVKRPWYFFQYKAVPDLIANTRLTYFEIIISVPIDFMQAPGLKEDDATEDSLKGAQLLVVILIFLFCTWFTKFFDLCAKDVMDNKKDSRERDTEWARRFGELK